MFSSSERFETWFAKWRSEADPAKHLADMRAANPILIPRNHRVEQAIQSAYGDDFAPFHRLVDALAAPYADQSNTLILKRHRDQKKSSTKLSAAPRLSVRGFGCHWVG